MSATQKIIERFPEMPGCTVTFDALHTNHKTMEKIVVEKKADFIIQVKGNTSQLENALKRCFDKKRANIQHARTVGKEHGRIETREIEMISVNPAETGWPHIFTALRITRKRGLIRQGVVVSTSNEVALYASSIPVYRWTPQEALKRIRGHWYVENGLHHRKDRSMDEDRNRASKKGIGRVMCCLRSLTALVLGRAKESLSVIQRRLSCKSHLLVNLLFSQSLEDWEQKYKAYKLA